MAHPAHRETVLPSLGMVTVCPLLLVNADEQDPPEIDAPPSTAMTYWLLVLEIDAVRSSPS